MSSGKSGVKGTGPKQTAGPQEIDPGDTAHSQMPTIKPGILSQRLAAEEKVAVSISPTPSGQAPSQLPDDGYGMAIPRRSPNENQIASLMDLASLLDSMILRREKMVRISKVLHSLLFSTMDARRSEIRPAEAKTFEWIFTSRSSSFIHWLQFSSGIFWIAGKAGSGKSTLMRYLSGHVQTFATLQKWGDGRRVVTASFFFWNSGTEMQRSQEGLLRSLLFEVFVKCPMLIEKMCPTRCTT